MQQAQDVPFIKNWKCHARRLEKEKELKPSLHIQEHIVAKKKINKHKEPRMSQWHNSSSCFKDGCMDAVVTDQRRFMVSIKSETVDGLTET